MIHFYCVILFLPFNFMTEDIFMYNLFINSIFNHSIVFL